MASKIFVFSSHTAERRKNTVISMFIYVASLSSHTAERHKNTEVSISKGVCLILKNLI